MGHNILIAAFIFSTISTVALILGAITKRKPILLCARICVILALGLVTTATVYMISLLLNHNFAIEYVAEYTMRDMSPLYLIGALWAGNLGTLLFWTWLIAVIGALVVLTSRERDRDLAPYATAIVMITEAFLLALMIFVQNPFKELLVVPAEGLGLNPLLKNLAMFLHPPIIMAGYAGFTVPFALAVAALVTGKLGNEWLVTARRWALLSWLLLGAGIIIGAWFSYSGLGEGRYWHWEPVENVSLIPWLSSTAFLHSIAMQRKRGVLKIWSMLLIILTFGVVIFSTLLNRSDIIASIHTFADSAFGPAFLGFLAVAMIVPLILLLLRRNQLESKLQIEYLVSKEGTFLLTNLLLLASTLAILIGTVFLLVNTEARALQTSLAIPFFNQVTAPIFLIIVLLAGICTIVGWRQVSLRTLGRNLVLPFAASVLLGVVLFAVGLRGWYPILGLGACLFVPFAVATEWIKSTRARHRSRGESYAKAFFNLVWADKPRHGGHIVHVALILIAAGIIGSSGYSVSKEVTLMPGESMTIGAYTLTYQKMEYTPASGRMTFNADVYVYKNGKFIGELQPSTYFDRSFNGEIKTADFRSTPIEDLYLTVAGWNETGLTGFKAAIYPLTMWIWVGGWLMMLGGLVAFWPEKQRAENIPNEEQNSAS